MTILLADDHGMFRDSMSRWLTVADADLQVETAATLDEALTRLGQNPNMRLLVLDLCMPCMNGVDSIRDILAEWPDLRILIISASQEASLIRRCIRLGAHGFVPKSSSGEALLEAIHIVLAGHIYLPRGMRLTDDDYGFTERQEDILRLLAEGASNREIAERLYLAESTVKQYVSDILDRLGVDSRVKAALRANEILGLKS